MRSVAGPTASLEVRQTHVSYHPDVRRAQVLKRIDLSRPVHSELQHAVAGVRTDPEQRPRNPHEIVLVALGLVHPARNEASEKVRGQGPRRRLAARPSDADYPSWKCVANAASQTVKAVEAARVPLNQD